MATIEERTLLIMPTIEDRARYIFANVEKKGVYDCWGNHAWQFSEYGALYAIEGAMKIQDRIARQEERERCIEIMQKWCCNHCAVAEVCYNLCGGNLDGDCNQKENIREAIEEGGNQ